MTLKESMDRLIWRFSKGQFTPNQNDIEALKNIAEWINRQKEQDLKSNYLLAKVYTYALNNELIFYKNLEFSNKKLQEVCKQPLETHLNTFLSTLNIQSMVEYQENKNISLKHPLSRNEKEENERLQKIKENEKDLIDIVKGVYDIDDVKNNITFQLTEIINKYKNYV